MAEEKSEELDLEEIPEEVAQAVGEDLKEKATQVIIRSPDKVVPSGVEPTMEMVLMEAVQRNIDPEGLKTLVGLKKELDSDKAREAFHKAMALFQSLCPVIPKATKGYKYHYASLEDVAPIIKEPLKRAKLSYSFNSKLVEKEDKTDKLEVVCTLTHALGHSKTAMFEGPIDDGKMMNDIQKMESSRSYGRRSSLFMVLGLIASGEDDDGNAGGGKVADDTITEEQAKELNTLIGDDSERLKTVLTTYNEQYPVEFLADLKAKDFQNCKNRLVKYNEAHK